MTWRKAVDMEALVVGTIVIVFVAGMAAALYADGIPKRTRRRDGRDRERARGRGTRR
jgi:hypothetical protein